MHLSLLAKKALEKYQVPLECPQIVEPERGRLFCVCLSFLV